MEEAYILEMNNIVKEFSSHRVLNNVSLHVKKGEVHALCGENGAGKSTLMKILSGAYPYGQYEGDILIDGKLQKFHNTKESAEAGVEIIYQELEIVPNMTVAENIFLGNEPRRRGIIDYNKMVNDSGEILSRLKIKINPAVLVEDLGVGMKQMVAIAKSLSRNPKVLILDEPSAALTEAETDNLLAIIKDLSRQGVACVYISHRLDEVLAIADNITVIRDGNTISTDRREDMDKAKLIKNMVGRELSDQFLKNKYEIGDVIFQVKGLTAREELTWKKILDNVSFDLKKGEIVGFAGLMGAGRTEVAMAIMGVLNAEVEGEILLEGKALNNKTPRSAINEGVSIVVEDRKDKGLVLGMDVKNNITLASLKSVSHLGVIDENQVIKSTSDYSRLLNIKAASIEMEVGSLSGGNQQKVVLAKALMTNPKVLILDEPTRGIDVGAKHEIYQIMNELIDKGMSIIMISSELPEVLAMADRIVVMEEGRVTGILDNQDLDQETIMRYATMEA